VSELSDRRPPITLRDTYRFFVPLMLMAELMMISHAVITAFLARMPDAQSTLAAYSVAFYFHAVVGSPVWALQIIVLSFLRDRASVHRLALFGVVLMLAVGSFQLMVGLTPIGDWIFQELYGTSADVSRQAKLCMSVSVMVFPFAIVRSLSYGLMMLNRKTLFVTLGTVVRMLALALLLSLLSSRYQGAVIGVIALMSCIGVESVYAVLLGRRYYLLMPRRSGDPPPLSVLWRFSWPVMLMQGAESGVAFSVNFFLGRLVNPELALAAFGVLDSLARVLLSPLRNLVQTVQSLVKTRADAAVVLVFALHMGVLFAAILLALRMPWLERWVLQDVMGLSPPLMQEVAPALGLGALLALAMAAAGVFRGLVIASHRTGIMAVSSGMRIAAVVVAGAVAVMLDVDNGAVMGMVALIAASATECAILLQRLRVLDRGRPRLFEAQRAETD
jgi:hypothetical protein